MQDWPCPKDDECWAAVRWMRSHHHTTSSPFLHQPCFSCSARRQGADHKRQAADLKKRLEAALAEQRRLALQVGRMQSSGGGRRHSLQLPSAICQGAAAVAADSDADAGAAAEARQFAEQQEQLAVTREHNRGLEEQLRQRELLVQQQARELSSLRAQLAAASVASRQAIPGHW